MFGKIDQKLEKLEKLDKLDKLENLEKLDKLEKLEKLDTLDLLDGEVKAMHGTLKMNRLEGEDNFKHQDKNDKLRVNSVDGEKKREEQLKLSIEKPEQL